MSLIVHHLLKWDYQPQFRSRIWQTTIQRERLNIRNICGIDQVSNSI
ncbi:DUF29 family protein [Pseudanabaena sp. Chao 1811]